MKHATPSPDVQQKSASAPAPSAGAAPVQLKQDLKTASYDEGRAMVSPGGAPVQMKAGNVQMSGTPPKLVDAIAIGTPSTYDDAGGHSYGRHGAHTTEAQQRRRLDEGIAPNGDRASVPATAPGASKFNSDADHVRAIRAAMTKLTEKNARRSDPATYKGINSKIGVSGAGTIYKRDGTDEQATDVHVDLQRVGSDGSFNLNTAFPTT